jgi:O-methyltransferase
MKKMMSSALAVPGLLRLHNKYKAFTMVRPGMFFENLLLAKAALRQPALGQGAVIECGTWKGGMAAALVEIGGKHRNYHFFDSFEGLPPAKAIDGSSALRYQADQDSPLYLDNCRASIEEFWTAIQLTGCPRERIDLRPGFFEDTFEHFDPPAIAVLRLDADWYESTISCLRKFWNHILPGGLVLIDDYYTWDGCARAVHAFLASIEAPERIRQGRVAGVAFIKKG